VKIAHQETPSTPNQTPNFVRFELAGASFTPRCFSASWSAFSPLLAAVGAAGGGFVFVPVAVSSLAVFGP
jgi:hypothetical protein